MHSRSNPQERRDDVSWWIVGPGQSPHTLTWVDELARRGHAPQVLSLGPTMRLARPAVLRSCLRAWTRRRPEVVIVQSLGRHGLFSLLLPKGRANVVVPWGSEVEPAQRSRFRRWVAGRVLRRAQLVLTTSEEMAGRIHRLARFNAPVQVISWGVEDIFFQHGGPARERVRGELGISPDVLLVLAPRGMSSTYRHEAIEAAFALAKQQRADIELISIRSDQDPPVAASGGRVIDRLDKAGLSDLFQAADLVISVPLRDQRSTAVLEALASGTQVVLAEIPPYREVMRDGASVTLLSEPLVPRLADVILQSAPGVRSPHNRAWAARSEGRSSQFDRIVGSIRTSIP